MIKKIAGYLLLILAFLLSGYFLFKVLLKSDKIIPLFNELLKDTSTFALLFTSLLFYLPLFIIIYISYSLGDKLIK
ncbi:hypothetical protein T190130A13A_10705 [Tenacibaculum sp. 190130A14a]|uniref:Uncharacterized protein n=1 Tax=Tenacibaculum polynesiense TaxID=3137857 RepID=A0ABM9P7J4_9FLAO